MREWTDGRTLGARASLSLAPDQDGALCLRACRHARVSGVEAHRQDHRNKILYWPFCLCGVASMLAKLRVVNVVPLDRPTRLSVPLLGLSLMQSAFESFVRGLIRQGSLEVETPAGQRIHAGDGSGPRLGIRFRNERAQWRLLADPELAFGELYMDGAIEITHGTLLDVLQLTLANLAQAGEARWLSVLHSLRTHLRRFTQYNDMLRARRNVAHHYDLDHRLYDFFLDADKQYSCAYFEHAGQSLEDAQLAKKRHLASKLLIEPGMRVLDIGCGWGGMALYLTRLCEARVTGITLSSEQLAVAMQRAQTSGLEQPPEFYLRDYRAESGRYERIISVGMFEHVGLGYYDAFFRKIADLLTEDGVAVLHTIGRPDVPSATNPFITKYIFPGGHLPALSEIMPAIERAGLMATDIEILRLHYADTLKEWHSRFTAHRAQIAQLYDERFCRMWEFYLSSSEASFRVGQAVNFQIQLARKVDSVPLIRDGMMAEEGRLRARETSGREPFVQA